MARPLDSFFNILARDWLVDAVLDDLHKGRLLFSWYAIKGDACVSCRLCECGNAPPLEWLFGRKRGSGATLTMMSDPLLSEVSFSPSVIIWSTISLRTGSVYRTMGILCCAILWELNV